MVSDELGTKRTCPSCAARFYDLNKNPIVCPKCDEAFVAEQLLPSKADLPTRAKPVDKPVEEEVKKDEGELEKDPVVVTPGRTLKTTIVMMMMMPMTRQQPSRALISVIPTTTMKPMIQTYSLDDEEDEASTGVADLIGGGPKPGGDESLSKTAETGRLTLSASCGYHADTAAALPCRTSEISRSGPVTKFEEISGS